MKALLTATLALLTSIFLGSAAQARECTGLSTAQCKERIREIDRAIAWLESKKAKAPVQTEAAFQACKASAPVGSDVSVVLNCMLDILGP